MNLVKWDPFSEIEEMQRSLFGGPFFGPKSVSPTTDIYTNDDKELVVEAHMPGFSKDDIDVDVHEGVLEIKGEKHEKDEDKKKKYVMREMSSSFYRRVHLPAHADEGKIEAEMDNGVLKVVVPFKDLPKPKKIAISEKAKSKK